MKLTFQNVLDRAPHRPPGYVEDILSAAGISAHPSSLCPQTSITIPDDSYAALCAKYRPPVPGLRALATGYGGAVKSWVDAGFPVLDEAEADHRADICALCSEFRLKDGTLTCRAYGCEPLKFWLESTPCLMGKWTKYP